MKNTFVSERTAGDIDAQVGKVLRGLGDPTPPIDLTQVRDLLKLDRAYYSSSDDGLLRETVHRMKVAGLQVLKRPMILLDAVRTLSLKALYLPDQKRILLDQSLPKIKHRWNEAHEIGHDIIPWHAGMMLGDNDQTLSQACQAHMENEANYAAGRLLFVGERFIEEAHALSPTLANIRRLGTAFDNTITSTLWRFVESAGDETPMVGVVSGHPHPAKRGQDFDPNEPCRYCIQSPSFSARFGTISEHTLFRTIASYSQARRGGPLGEREVVLADINGDRHVFHFSTFFNGHEALTLGVWMRAATAAVSVPR
jgi:Zn-dependent peptidase ImmA (M78 family)